MKPRNRLALIAGFALGFGLALAPEAMGQNSPPVRWFPPASDSTCYAQNQECAFRAYLDHLAGRITDSEVTERLAQCRIRLGWCSLLEQLSAEYGEEVAMEFLLAVGPNPELAEFFADGPNSPGPGVGGPLDGQPKTEIVDPFTGNDRDDHGYVEPAIDPRKQPR